MAILLPLGAGDGTPARLVRVSGDDQHSQAGSALAKPFVVEVTDRVGVPVSGAEVTFTVIVGGGSLSVENATTDADGRAESVLTLGPEPVTNRVAVSVTGIPGSVSFTAVAGELVVSAASPLSEPALDGSVVTLTLNGRTYKHSDYFSHYSVAVTGIDGVTFHPPTDVKRVSDTEVTVELSFNGNIETDAKLTFTVGGEDALDDGSGLALTGEIPVTAVTESLVASTASPLSESTLEGSVVTLTLNGRPYVHSDDLRAKSISVSGIEGVTFHPITGVERPSETEVTIKLLFSGNIDADAKLTFTVDSDAIANYTGPALTAEISVTVVTESLVASTASPLTESTLEGSVVTLTLNGLSFVRNSLVIASAVTVSGIEGVTFWRFGVERVSDTEATMELSFDGDTDTDATLTFAVGMNAIANYTGPALTAEIHVTAVTESLVASTASPLTESTLNGSVVTLTLNGHSYQSWNRVRNNLAVMGIGGVAFSSFDVKRLSDTEATLELSFDGDIDTDATLTFAVGMNAIANYSGPALTAEILVTAVTESLVASTASPLTGPTLEGAVVTLTLNGRSFERSVDIVRAATVSGIEGVDYWGLRDLERLSDTEVTIRLRFDGDIEADATLTLTVGADAIAGYTGPPLTADLFVAADKKSTADFDSDGRVGFSDFLQFAIHFGLSQGNEAYEAKYDLDGDGTTGFGDFLLFANAFGKDAPSPGNGGGPTAPSPITQPPVTPVEPTEFTITVEHPYPVNVRPVPQHPGIPEVTVTCLTGCEGQQIGTTDQ
ncbi:MAG: hypothetical protein J4F39_12200, partial [Candidatus Latescibacteria bacterium]|nr:hypothetical protein [Candidatus Latescibacterota bacterium]